MVPAAIFIAASLRRNHFIGRTITDHERIKTVFQNPWSLRCLIGEYEVVVEPRSTNHPNTISPINL